MGSRQVEVGPGRDSPKNPAEPARKPHVGRRLARRDWLVSAHGRQGRGRKIFPRARRGTARKARARNHRTGQGRRRLPPQLRQSAAHGPSGHRRAIREIHLLRRTAPMAEDWMEEKNRF